MNSIQDLNLKIVTEREKKRSILNVGGLEVKEYSQLLEFEFKLIYLNLK